LGGKSLQNPKTKNEGMKVNIQKVWEKPVPNGKKITTGGGAADRTWNRTMPYGKKEQGALWDGGKRGGPAIRGDKNMRREEGLSPGEEIGKKKTEQGKG